MRMLVWFRTDLRVDDNTALLRACERAGGPRGDGVVAVFAICPEQWKERHDWGSPKAAFVLDNLRELAGSLQRLRIPLKVITVPTFDGLPPKIIDLATESGCRAIYFNDEYEINEVLRDEAVREAADEAGVEVHGFTDQVIWKPGRVRTQSDGWYTVYSPFKKRCWSIWNENDRPELGSTPSKQAEIDIDADDIPETIDGFELEQSEETGVRPDLWSPGEKAAKTRLGKFIADRASAYKDERDYPAINGTSTLSPYLAAGVLSPRQCIYAALDANKGRIDSGDKGITGWIEELLWREFYKHLLIAFPRLCKGQAFRPEMDKVGWSYAERRFEAWTQGQTGFPIVDAAMRQLNRTGWMHNRLRMIVAMFLTKDLLIDWRWGERYFASRLVDLDFASNNGGWQWSASTGTDSQPYFRIFNPTTQGERFDPDGEFVRKFVPELSGINGKKVHNPEKSGLFDGDTDYPTPMVDHKEMRERTLEKFKALK